MPYGHEKQTIEQQNNIKMPEEPKTTLNILFVLPGGIDGNNGYHVTTLVNGLKRFNIECAVAVPDGTEDQTIDNQHSLQVLSYTHLLEYGPHYTDEAGPDIIHAWTPRESVRNIVKQFTENRPYPVVIHLEDNEIYLTESTTGFSCQEMLDMPTAQLDDLVPPDRYHPIQGHMWLQAAQGITMITDTLQSFNYGNLPKIIIQPPPDDKLFYHRPVNYKLRRELNIPSGNLVLTYNGNVHDGNREEVLELYKAVKLLNHEGTPATLLRTGINSVPLEENDTAWISSIEKYLGWVDRKDLPDIMAAADLFVQPGNPDTFNNKRIPCKLPEYFALGRPVILPRANLGLKLEHGQNAWVLDSASAEDIADAIKVIHNDRALSRKLAVGALAYYALTLADITTFSKLNTFYRGLVQKEKPVQPTVIQKPSGKTKLRILFVLPAFLDSKYGCQVEQLARRMQLNGVESAAAVPDTDSYNEDNYSEHLQVLNYSEIIQNGLQFTDQDKPDLIHTWTPKEIVRNFVETLTSKWNCPIIIHLDNNEQLYTEAITKIPFNKLENMSIEKLDSIIPEYCYHPVHGKKMLINSSGLTIAIDTLSEFNYGNQPILHLSPQVDERYYYPRPLNYQLRRELNIPDDHTVIVYPGNVDASNCNEVAELYKAVHSLNNQGCPTTLIRTGIDHVKDLINGLPKSNKFIKNLGWVNRKELPEIIAAANILVQPGKADQKNKYRIPYKMPQFLALGRPVVLPKSNIGHLLENEKEAFVLDEVNADKIFEAVIRIKNDRFYAGSLAANAAAFYRTRMDDTTTTKKLYSFYQTPINTSGRICTV